MYSKYLPPKTYTKSISLRLSRESTVCLSSPIPTRQQVRKRADLVDGHSSCSGDRADSADEHCSCSGNRADSVDEHLAAGMRRADR